MQGQSDESLWALTLGLVFGLIALVLALVLGFVLKQAGSPLQRIIAAPSTPLVAIAEVPQNQPANAEQAASDAASVKIEYGVVRFYFASGQAGLAPGALDALAGVLDAARQGRQIVISGFHDPSGDARQNALLATQRANAVRDALRAAGVKPSQITLKEPTATVSGESDADARRVEISLR